MTADERHSLAEAWARHRRNGTVVCIASVFLNLIVFAGSIYMMLVYDSVLPSGSMATLAGLFGLLLVLYAFQAVFEAIRAEAMLNIANGVHGDFAATVHRATGDQALANPARGQDGMQLIRDLDQVHGFLTSAGPIALIDLPWFLLFMIVLATLHWALGLTALLGTLALLALAAHTGRESARGAASLGTVIGSRAASALQEIRFIETATALGMRDRLSRRSGAFEQRYITAQTFLSRNSLRLGSAGRILRLLLQSLMLTVGAVLVIRGSASGGVILASSVLTGRALAPVDTVIANWRSMAAARAGWARLQAVMQGHQPPPARTVTLDAPHGTLDVRDIWLAPPGSRQSVLNGVSFSINPGEALAIIGPSAAGKTSLTKALTGIWRPARGEIRIDGATYDQWDAETFGRSIGYVSQSVDLIEGTIGENIARFDPEARSTEIIAAARSAGMHETILAMPDGYDTAISQSGGELSAGQKQRLGLARALYGDPYLLVLDEANSNLDAEGDAALLAAVEAVKARGGIVVMVTHRPATLAPATHIAVMGQGKILQIGPREDILARMGLGPVPNGAATRQSAGVAAA